MKFYESGDNRKPVIFLFPGTCCLYSSFDHVLDGLHTYFCTVTVSYDGFLNMFGIDKGGCPWITKQSIYNQFYSDLVTKVQHGIDVPGTTIHVFYATMMGRKYQWMQRWRRVSSSWLANIRWKRLRSSRSQMGQG